MNYIKNNGFEIIVNDTQIIYNNVSYNLPKNCKGHSNTIINGKVYIDGYEFRNGKFKKTLMALWHKYF